MLQLSDISFLHLSIAAFLNQAAKEDIILDSFNPTEKATWQIHAIAPINQNIAKGTTDPRVECSWQSVYLNKIQTSYNKLILGFGKKILETVGKR